MKTNELTGAALDWAVALIEYPEWKEQGYLDVFPYDLHFDDGEIYAPSTNWAQGGATIEREGITILSTESGEWCATIGELYYEDDEPRSPTPLIAAMRCYVASKLGDEVEIPSELTDEVFTDDD